MRQNRKEVPTRTRKSMRPREKRKQVLLLAAIIILVALASALGIFFAVNFRD